MPIFIGRVNVGHNNCFSKQLMWVIVLFCASFVPSVIFNVLDGNLCEGSREGLGSWIYINLH